MDSEIWIAMVGGGSALLGAAVGGAAAVVSARIQGKHATKVARDATRGAHDLARRTAQQAAYARLLDVANEFEAATGRVLVFAADVIDDVNYTLANSQSRLGRESRQSYLRQIAEVRDPERVLAAVRHVGLEGPSTVYQAAKGVQDTANKLARTLGNLRSIYTEEDQPVRAALEPTRPHRDHTRFQSAISTFADTASAHLNNNG
ncbi:hypothetical protein [Streptomyces sp. NPDC086776]|uniref:hypothetical protein n=1 Tax=Streptomyces sp. NPDC086776 TaxID=3365756 RepID=UPI003828D76B